MNQRFELRNKERGVKIRLSGDFIRLGRAADNNIVINDASVSRNHLNLYIKDGSLIVEDAGSKTGFFVNGIAQRDPVVLKNGDILKFGSQTYSVFIGKSEEVAAHVQSPQADPNASATDSNAKKRKLLLGAVAAIFIALALMPKQEAKTPLVQDIVLNANDLERSLDASEMVTARIANKSRGEIEAEGKFNEGLREYNNGNYVRAINRFEEALTQNPNMETANDYLQFAKARLKIQITHFMQDGQRSFAVLQYARAKAQFMNVLSILSEQIPGYWQQVAQKVMNTSETARKPAQEEYLLNIPCDKTREESICKLAIEMIKQSRQFLGEEDTLR
jgi:pSer/pThr/pTyr-binding forkhead associated (FHA) protein